MGVRRIGGMWPALVAAGCWWIAGCAAEPALDPPPGAVEKALVVSGGTVVTMDPEGRIIEDGAVAIVDGAIAAVGPAAQVAEAFPTAERLDASGSLVVPGLVNAHTHAPMTLFRGLADDLELVDWLENHIFPAEAEHVDEEFVRWGTRLACLEMLAAGTTTFADMYYYEDVIAEEAEQCGMRAVVGETLIDFPAPDNASWEEAVDYTRRFVERWRDHPRIVPAVAPHSAYTVSTAHLVEAHALAEELGVPLLTHLAEDRAEIERVQAATGRTSVELFEALGVLSDRLVAAHVVWPSADEIALLATRRVGVAHCPQSNMKIAAGAAPVPAMLAAGVAVGLGTDGAGSNNDLDLWGEMDTAAKLHKLVTGDPTVVDARQAFEMATLGGARALGLGDLVGSLEVGKRADLVVVASGGFHQAPQSAAGNPYSLLVYATRPSDVETVIVDGTILVREGHVLGVDVEEVLERAGAIRRAVEATLDASS